MNVKWIQWLSLFKWKKTQPWMTLNYFSRHLGENLSGYILEVRLGIVKACLSGAINQIIQGIILRSKKYNITNQIKYKYPKEI